jgi:hypothetical protein
MQHIFNIASDIEDEHIKNMIEEQAKSEVIKMICSKVESVIYGHYYGTQVNKNDLSPLRDMVCRKIDETIKENKDYILNEAAKILADKLLRTKAAKALLEGK